eukprot:TRINITY_DN14921_c0_g3_i1.p1 TRINITY_DN14921_c0_g3~~TRINITY_DN14921_c0_g3_i1.p1  ORF type:complete len:265 (-),score=39.49 TRINITY_DN14921_c0_g3_i1:101-895(-)
MHLPWLFSLFISMFPVGYMSVTLIIPRPRAGAGGVEYLSLARMLLLTGYTLTGLSLALLLKVRSGGGKSSHRPGHPSHVHTSTGEVWMTRAGNWAVSMSFCGALTVNALYFGGSELVLFLVSPVFLLLETKDTVLGRSHRYLAPVFVCSSLAAATVIMKLHFGFLLRELSVPYNQYPASTYALLRKHTILLLCTLPSHFHAVRYLWNQAPCSRNRVLMLLPLNLFCIIWSEMPVLVWMGVLGIVYSGLLVHTIRSTREAGHRML